MPGLVLHQQTTISYKPLLLPREIYVADGDHHILVKSKEHIVSDEKKRVRTIRDKVKTDCVLKKLERGAVFCLLSQRGLKSNNFLHI